jgi:RNA polymerase primary sigma factor
MPKKKSANTTKTATKKKATTKKVVEKKAKAKTTSKKKEEINPSDFLQKENENQLKSLITKEFDKELTEKSAAYIKSFVKIEDSIISVNDFLNYVENLDEDLFKLFKAYTNSSDNDISSSSDDSEEEEKSTGVKSDDPVRMYLKEMGNVELLSREGEIAIAKRIESGLDRMMKSILECPASLDILKKWIDQVKLNEINLREIVDFDEYFTEDNDPYSNSSKRKEIQKIINDKKKALIKEKEKLMKEQGIEIDKEKLVESTSEEDVENESFSISIIEEFYKPEILKKLD